MRLRVRVTGIVQGVGFRPFIYRIAVEHQLRGYVKNRGDAGVEIILEGEEQSIEQFMKDLRDRKPPLANIYEVITSKLEGKNEYASFIVEKSSSASELSGSVVPPDVAICGDCLRELRDPNDSRYEYFFITCTNCGPRFTIIEKLPYDRANTTMREFPMCDFCLNEYNDPTNRRFHAQTIACPNCGPKAYLATATGEIVEQSDPIREAGRLLSEGKILAIKGYGGFHIAASTIKDEPLNRLRKTKHRAKKPFAIMARSLKAIETFAKIGKEEQDLLLSSTRPIVLLNKRSDYSLSNLVAPGLHNVGVMLPYTGLHYLLFDKVHDASFVMTSANPPNQPIIKDNHEALSTLSKTVDYFLFHDRQIAQRCDDSVARMHDARSVFIRRSRGYAPAPVLLSERSKQGVLALGGELNNTACILNGDKAFISQHIGDVENVETKDFLELSAKHLIGLTNSRIDTVVSDLHPKFTTTVLANELAKENGWQLKQVQHHHAHIAGLMAEHGVDEIVGVCCDGYGYGLDGKAWGGEILLCSMGNPSFERLGHLEKQPMTGGDLTTKYPLRTLAGVLRGNPEVETFLWENATHFPHGEKEIEILLQQLKRSKGLAETTSCGRILDAVAGALGVCYERTYEGEPSMLLESMAIDGKDVLRLKPVIKKNILETTPLLLQIFESRSKYSKKDLAYSAHEYIASGLAELAVRLAEENRVRTVGFSGGVACNKIITARMREKTVSSNIEFLVHASVPPGDGGLSFGQAAVSGFSRI